MDRIVKRQEQIEKFCRNSDATDETIQMLLLHSKQLAQLICDMKSNTVPEASTQPRNDVADWIREFNKSIIKN
jgi:hypothetical protein